MFSEYNFLIFYAILCLSEKVCCAKNHSGEGLVHKCLLKDQSKQSNNELAEDFRKSSSQTNDNVLTHLIPMLATPFLIQTTFLPMMLLGIKIMLIQSIVLGKFAIIFWLVNLLRTKLKDQQGQFYSHNVHIGHVS